MSQLIFTAPIALGCEVDPSLRSIIGAYEEDPSLLLIILGKSFPTRTLSIVPEFAGHDKSCWFIEADDEQVPASRMKRPRLILGRALGLYPAFMYDFLPTWYDSIRTSSLRYELAVNCRFLRGRCVRPSHLCLCTKDGRPVKTLLS